MMVRLMGRKASVDAQMEGFRNDLGAHTEVHEGDSLWEHHNARWATVDGSVRMVIGGRSAALRPLTMELAGRRDITDLAVSLGTGTLRIAFDPDVIPRDEIAGHLGRFAVTWVVESAPAGWRGRDSVWGPARPEQALAAAIKAQFDPAEVLNRGRLFI
jgi:hypothetical protein